MAIFVLLMFFTINYFTDAMGSGWERFTNVATGIVFLLIMLLIALSIVALTFLFLLVSMFGIEYMLLLEEKGSTDFTFSDILKNIKAKIGKYILFFLSSIVVGLILSLPVGIIYMILVFIPLLGMIGIGILTTMLMLFLYTALFMYLQSRATLWDSYTASFKLIKGKIFEYALASYLVQMIIQTILGIVIIVPTVIIFISGFTMFGFDSIDRLSGSFGGKFIIALGTSLFTLFVIFSTVYLISFYVFQYFSLLEVNLSEKTLENIDQIGSTEDEF
jgi:hypothetical protein